MLKDEVEQRCNDWQRALQEVGSELKTKHGEKSPLYKLMGPLAWGRSPHEGSGKDTALQALGYMEGVRDAAVHIGRVLELPGSDLFERIHDRIAGYRAARKS